MELCTKALNHPNVLLGPIGRDQRESHHASAEDDVVEDGRGVSRGAAAEHAPRPPIGNTPRWPHTTMWLCSCCR